MTRKLFFLFLISLCSICYPKLPNLTPNDVKSKLEEILKVHVTYKTLTPELAKRILQNLIEELDPLKLYFIEPDINQWLKPSDPLISQILESFKTSNYQVFDSIFIKMNEAIERRNKIEAEIEKVSLPKDVDSQEFMDIKWATSREELFQRLLKIKALQLEVAEKLHEPEDIFLQRLKKRRLHKEADIVNSTENRKILILTDILKAAASSLDTHTNYFTPSEAKEFLIQVQQMLSGIGAQLKDSLNGFTIVRMIEGGPASKNNKLKINDRIIAVDGEPVVGLDITEAVELIRGEKGSSVTLTILRDMGDNKTEKLDIKLIRGEVVLEESRIDSQVEPYADGMIAIIGLHCFYQDNKSSSADDLKKALDKIKSCYKLKGVLLDLRNNAGGLLPQAVAVSSLFITKGIVVSIKDSTGYVQHLRDTDNKPLWDGPLLILTNRASASAAEIVSQSLQDYGRAILVGDDKTFGKGTFQTFSLDASRSSKINPKGEYKVTRGKYYTVSGRSPQLVGVKTDIVIPGILSEMEIGEQFSKFPLANDSIKPNFDDDLSDIPPEHRKRIGLFYRHNLQPILTKYTQYLETLRKNSSKRIELCKNYQDFLKEIKNKHFDSENVELLDHGDLQLAEAKNIMKDLVYLDEMNNKSFE